MTSDLQHRTALYFWERFGPNNNEAMRLPAGKDLAALRRGLGAEPGSRPEMWTYYTTLTSGGYLTKQLWAEHAALSLYGLHQQSETLPMHRPALTVGHSLHVLRASERYSSEAVDARVERAATATDMAEMTHHLRGLIQMLKSLRPAQGFDYTLLLRDLVDWQSPESIGRVRRRWGADYLGKSTKPSANDGTS